MEVRDVLGEHYVFPSGRATLRENRGGVTRKKISRGKRGRGRLPHGRKSAPLLGWEGPRAEV